VTLRLWALGTAAIVLLLDQLTKWWAVNGLADGPMELIDGFLQLDLTYNTGAAFSFFAQSGPFLGIVVIGVILLILFALKDASHVTEAIALGLVLGGALGNLTDRLFRGDGFVDGAVVDFIDFSFFATFNVADSAVTIGVALLLISTVVRRR
jgi:signal peptidase II